MNHAHRICILNKKMNQRNLDVDVHTVSAKYEMFVQHLISFHYPREFFFFFYSESVQIGAKLVQND